MSQLHRDKILALLTEHSADFEHSVHEAVTTSEHASAIRGVPLSSGAKAIVLENTKDASEHVLVVIPADKRIDFKKLKEITGKKFEFAKDPTAVVDCVPGSVPPFGSVLGLKTYTDEGIADKLNFNIGLLTESVGLAKSEYLRIENPEMVSVVKGE